MVCLRVGPFRLNAVEGCLNGLEDRSSFSSDTFVANKKKFLPQVRVSVR